MFCVRGGVRVCRVVALSSWQAWAGWRHTLLLCDQSCVYNSHKPVEFGHMT